MPTDTRACSCDQCCRTNDFHDVRSSLETATAQNLACHAALATHPGVATRLATLPAAIDIARPISIAAGSVATRSAAN